MSEYQLQVKQIVDYPRCRVYRQFIQSLMNDRSICTNGGSGLFYYTVLCSYASAHTASRHIDGISYTVYPGEWVCTVKELSAWFRTCFQCQAVGILRELQNQYFISFLLLDRGKVIKYKIRNWNKHNTVLGYDCPNQKDTGFFYLPLTTATELISAERCSEMDIVLDLWMSAIYSEEQIQGSEIGPVVYLRNGTGCPVVSHQEMAVRWGISKASALRIIKKLVKKEYLSLMTFPGKAESVIYLQNYLSTMFQVSDVMLDKEEVAMVFRINVTLPGKGLDMEDIAGTGHGMYVPGESFCVSNPQIAVILQKMANILDSQGISCFRCHKSRYKLFPLSDGCKGKYMNAEAGGCSFGLAVLCGDQPVCRFELALSLIEGDKRQRGWNA